MRWDNRLIARRVVRWPDAVRKGKADRRTINIPPEFVTGGSIGPVSVPSVLETDNVLSLGQILRLVSCVLPSWV
jgi:hypothetical protein